MTNSDPWLNVWFQKISIPPPWKNIGNSEGEGSQKPKSFLRKYKAKLEIPRRGGGGGGGQTKNFPWEGMDIFCNNKIII